MQSPQSALIILPAAGYGRRVGSPESKEILPLRNNEPLIKKPLDLCQKKNWPALLITRKEKKSLLQFVSDYKNVDICFVGETKEWPDSILQSEKHWQEWNLVMLPDTEFQPESVLPDMLSMTESADLIVATHKVADSKAWGVLKATEEGVKIGEKCEGEQRAWGLFMFRKEWGRRILEAQLKSFQESLWVELRGCRTKEIGLDLFQDLTRGN